MELYRNALYKDPNLVAYWKLEDLIDIKGGHNFANHGSVPFNQAIYRNGADYGVTNTTKFLDVLTDNFGIAGNSDVSVSLWVKIRTEPSGLTALFELLSQLTANRYLLLDYDFNSGTPRLHVDASNGTQINYNITLGTANFYHFVVTRNIAANTVTLYVNGVAVGTCNIGTSTAGHDQFTLGSNNGGGQLSSAIFDDISIFSRVLTAIEVRSLYRPKHSGAFIGMML